MPTRIDPWGMARGSAKHKFKRGQLVKLISSMAPRGDYKIVALLGHNGRFFEYQIRHATEKHERVAPENHLDRIEQRG